MSWTNEDGIHEGWTACEIRDGRLSYGSMAGGVLVAPDGHGRYPLESLGLSEVVPRSNIVGWRGTCECGWHGERWDRVARAELEDPTRRQVYAGDEDHTPAWVEDSTHDEWKRHRPALVAKPTATVRDQATGPLERELLAGKMRARLDVGRDRRSAGLPDAIRLRTVEVEVIADLLDELAGVYAGEGLGQLARELSVRLWARLGI